MVTFSIVIPAYNEERCISRCIECILSQTRRDFEIIVVDDGSTDRTVEMVTSFKGVVLLKQDHGGPGGARNMAASVARGRILVFNDADMFMDRRYLEFIGAPIERGDAPGTFPKDEFVDNRGNFWADCWSVASGLPPGRRIHPDHPDTSGVFRALLLESFKSVGGYDDIGVGEDFTLSKKLGFEAVNAPGAVIYHENPGSLSETFSAARWYGRGWYMNKGLWARLKGLLRHLPPVSLFDGIAGAISSGIWGYALYKPFHGLAVATGLIDYAMARGHAK